MFTWETFAFLPLALIAFGYSGYKLLTLVRMMFALKGKHRAVGSLATRFTTTITNVFFQKAVLQKPIPGIMHAAIFWGFIVITIGTVEQMLGTLFSGANFEFIGHGAYGALVYAQDFFALFVLVGVVYSFYRRLVLKPTHLTLSRDALFILFFTGSLMVSIFLMNAFHILGSDAWFHDSQPISGWLATLLAPLDFPGDSAIALSKGFKWTHLLIVLGFSMYIPGSKHLHILAAGPNTFFRHLGRPKGMTNTDLEAENATQFGAAKISDYSWKDALDYYSCTECGRCQELCPAWNTQKPLSPKHLIIDQKYNLFRNQAAILAHNTDAVTPVIDGKVTEDVIWACTSCRACEIACPVFIQHTDKIFESRRNLVLMESKFPAEVQTVFKNLEAQGTPWAFSAHDRANWAQGLNVPLASTTKDFDILLWVGCAGSYDERNKKVLRAFVSLLNKAQVKFAILGNEERCTGDPARRIGNEYLFQTLAAGNVQVLNQNGVKKIITSCPHCFNTLKNEYPDFGGHYEVTHHSDFLASLIRSGKLKATQKLNDKITFHDSCYLGRWNGIYSAPREILNASAASEVVEMSQSGDQSLCCGAGGGRMFMEEKIGTRINEKRTDQAIATGAKVIAASCPFCMTMLTDGVKTKKSEAQVLDIAEILDQATASAPQNT